eukprot:g14305.t1
MAAAAVASPPTDFSCVGGGSSASSSPDAYVRLKEVQQQLEFLHIREAYVKEEMKNLKREMIRAREEVKRVQSVPLIIGTFAELVDQDHAIVQSNSSTYYVRVLSTLNREDLKPSNSVALHRHSHAVVGLVPPEADSSVMNLAATEKPDVTYIHFYGFSPLSSFAQGFSMPENK